VNRGADKRRLTTRCSGAREADFAYIIGVFGARPLTVSVGLLRIVISAKKQRRGDALLAQIETTSTRAS
jgi:hypothetical protein